MSDDGKLRNWEPVIGGNFYVCCCGVTFHFPVTASFVEFKQGDGCPVCGERKGYLCSPVTWDDVLAANAQGYDVFKEATSCG